MTNVFAMRENRYTPFRIQGDTYHAQLEIPASPFDNVEKIKKTNRPAMNNSGKKTYNNNDTNKDRTEQRRLLIANK